MKRLFQAYLVALAAAALMMMAGPPAMDAVRQQIPQGYWTLAGLSVWTVNGGWFWVLIAWMVYRFTQRKTEAAAPPAKQPQPPPLPPSNRLSDNFSDYLASKFGR